VTGWLPRTGRAATVVAAVLGPGVAAYTGVLLSDTAVPTWHEAHRELPYLFVSSAAAAAGGLGLALVRSEQARPARNLAMVGGGGELVAKSLLIRRLGPTAEPYQSGQASHLMEAAEVLTAGALSAAALGGRKRVVAALAGAVLVAPSALTRSGVFHAGRTSARDPKYTVVPQRDRIRRRIRLNPPRARFNQPGLVAAALFPGQAIALWRTNAVRGLSGLAGGPGRGRGHRRRPGRGPRP
jgi:hypothetical protein